MRVVADDDGASMTLTGAHAREAGKLLNWSRVQLGHRVGVSAAAIELFEVPRRLLRHKNVQAIGSTLEAAGVEFIAENGGGRGVRLRDPS